MRSMLDRLIRIQQAIPITLPNEYLAWKNYGTKYSKTCDSCHNQKGCYKITYQDPFIPMTVLVPRPLRLCAECLAEADEQVGMITQKQEGKDTFEIERV